MVPWDILASERSVRKGQMNTKMTWEVHDPWGKIKSLHVIFHSRCKLRYLRSWTDKTNVKNWPLWNKREWWGPEAEHTHCTKGHSNSVWKRIALQKNPLADHSVEAVSLQFPWQRQVPGLAWLTPRCGFSALPLTGYLTFKTSLHLMSIHFPVIKWKW